MVKEKLFSFNYYTIGSFPRQSQKIKLAKNVKKEWFNCIETSEAYQKKKFQKRSQEKWRDLLFCFFFLIIIELLVAEHKMTHTLTKTKQL